VPRPDFDLYLVTDRKLTQGRDLLAVLEQALNGGVKAIQLREKDLDGKALFELAEKIAALCQNYRAELYINDRIDVALAVDAAGVQLGKNSIPIETARDLLGLEKSIGYSSHSLAEARAAERSGADFILFGPVYFTPSKDSYGAPQGLTPLREILESVTLPVYAIGGINRVNLEEVRGTGVRGVALISAIISAADIKTAAQQILTNLAR
jgi:thiamine-phosphate pyrophosphorylase